MKEKHCKGPQKTYKKAASFDMPDLEHTRSLEKDKAILR